MFLQKKKKIFMSQSYFNTIKLGFNNGFITYNIYMFYGQ